MREQEMNDRRQLVVWLAALVLLCPLVVLTAPALSSSFRLAAAVRGKSWAVRRAFVFGDYVPKLAALSRVIPDDAPVAIIPARAADRDLAMFSVYHLYPRSARVFGSLAAWRTNDHDGSDRRTPPPAWVILIDEAHADRMKLLHDDGGMLREVAAR